MQRKSEKLEHESGMRELVRGGHYSALNALYDSVSGVLSELVRTAIIPEEGQRIVVADFSAIEARVTAWFAGEEWRLQTFRDGVDALAVAVGNAHGVYKSKPCIQLQRIAELNAAVKCPLVMHGGSGLSDDDFKNAIERGVAKMNIHTDMVCAGMRAMYEQCDAHNRDKIVTWDYLDTRKAKVEAIKAVVARKLQLFGSVGRA